MQSLESWLPESLNYTGTVNVFLHSECSDILLDSIVYITPKVICLIKSI